MKKKKNIKPVSIKPARKENYWVPLLAILVITFIAYLPVLQNGFVNLDDDKYILENRGLHSINPVLIFSEYVMGNYHPLTMLVYSIEYQFFGLDPAGYHAVNLLLHLLNVTLVFFTLFRLTKNATIALTAALLFGIHPIHTESVAWASELKDLLYTFFFLFSWLFYLKFMDDRRAKFFIAAIGMFLLSLLSKGMAVSLPVVLLLTDFLRKRKIDKALVLEKIPFFILAVVFGVVAILAQKSSGSIQDLSVYPLPQRIIFACFGFVTYLFKLFVPVHLTAFYPYPVNAGEPVPGIFYVYVAVFVLIMAGVLYSLRKTRKIAFGIMFFLATVFLVLQLLPVGGAVMADRYTYIPSIGIFYLLGVGINLLLNPSGKTLNRKLTVSLFAIPVVAIFVVLTYRQCDIWENGMTLWNDVLKKEPTVSLAYNNRAALWMEEKNFPAAEEDYNNAIKYRKGYAEAYQNRGVLLAGLNRYDEALKDYAKAIELKPAFTEAYNNRGMLYSNQQKFADALRDFNKALEFSPGIAYIYNNRGNLYLNHQQYDSAMADYNKTLALDPSYLKAYNGRGVLYLRQQKNEAAITEFNKAIQLDPAAGDSYYNRAIAEYNIGKKNEACQDLNEAVRFGNPSAGAFINQWCK